MTDRAPAEVWPLACHLAEEMQARGWMAEDVAIRLKTGDGFVRDLMALNLLLCVHRDKLLVGDKLFSGLARAFDVDEQYFRKLDSVWRENPSKRTPWECPEELFGAASREALAQICPPRTETGE
jgi:hypothetical protein